MDYFLRCFSLFIYSGRRSHDYDYNNGSNHNYRCRWWHCWLVVFGWIKSREGKKEYSLSSKSSVSVLDRKDLIKAEDRQPIGTAGCLFLIDLY